MTVADGSFATVTDRELLALVMGARTANRVYRGSLASLLAPRPADGADVSKLHAARELIRRALCEELRQRCVMTTPSVVREYLQASIGGLEHEVFAVLFLDAQHALIESEEMFRGTLNQTSVYPREVVKSALRKNAAAVILAHNHPSGLAEPSRADESLTRALVSALALVDVRVLDHIVVGRQQSVSFAERGLL